MTLQEKIRSAVTEAVAGLYPEYPLEKIVLEYPPKREFGDYSSNAALQIAGRVRQNPMDIAQQIAEKISLPEIEKISLLAPGFINFTISDEILLKQVPIIIKKKESYSENSSGKGTHVNIEFISANPTGPLTLANGRGGFFGDVLGNILEKNGCIVGRDYYVNDSGNQVNVLAESVLRKYYIKQGIPMEYPEECYQGEYINELAEQVTIPNYNIAKSGMKIIRDKIKDKIVHKMLQSIKKSIKEKMHISFDTFFSEKSLYEKGGAVDQTLAMLHDRDFVYEKDNALWLKTSEYGDEKDRVLQKSSGEYTYFLPDIAYHLNKFETRGFDKAITIVGADHHGYIGRMFAAMDMFGHKKQLSMVVMQLVRLIEHGKEVRMSKRKGTYVTIDEVVEDVGLDATRYFFLMHAPNTHMDFDLTLAKEKSEKNPVYYVQYAHARMCSILKTVEAEKKKTSKERTFQHNTRELLIMLIRWPEVLRETADDLSVHRIPDFAHKLATAVHAFYTTERVLSQDGSVNQSLYDIVVASKIIINDILSVMGVTAPERME